MRIFLAVFILLTFVSSVYAKLPNALSSELPKGVFKKKHNGQIVQYDSKGKKIGVYKMKNGRLIQIK